jgi:competence protein ComEC
VFFSVIFIVFFMAMIGWTPSIMRAGIMAIIAVIAWAVGRKVEPWRLILLVAAVTLLINPMYINNLGWLLSFASFAGIMILGPEFTRYFYGEKKPGFVMGVIMATVAATLMTLPIILYYYGMVSLVSVVANLLILPTLPYAMGLVFLVGLVAGVPGVSMVVGWCAKMMLDYHIAVVGWFSEMRMFLVEMPKYQWWVFVIYVVIGMGFLWGFVIKKWKE